MKTDFFDNWITQVRKGMLQLCILNAMKDCRLYGYDIVKKLREIDGLMISEGTIYPILSRLKQQGLVRTFLEESQEGPARKYYQLTQRGQRLLAEMNGHWDVMKDGTERLRNKEKE